MKEIDVDKLDLKELFVKAIPTTCLDSADEAYLEALILALRSGQKAVFIVEQSDEKLKYMFSNASRAEAVSMLGKVVEATGRRLAGSDE